MYLLERFSVFHDAAQIPPSSTLIKPYQTPTKPNIKFVHFDQSLRKAVCVIFLKPLIDHFTVVCLVAWPLNESETGVDLVLIETMLFLCE